MHPNYPLLEQVFALPISNGIYKLVLLVLALRHPVTISAATVAARLGRGPANMTLVLEALCEEGWVDRSGPPTRPLYGLNITRVAELTTHHPPEEAHHE